jgi:hypothetical protein
MTIGHWTKVSEITDPMETYWDIDCCDDCDDCELTCAKMCMRYPDMVCIGCPCLHAKC